MILSKVEKGTVVKIDNKIMIVIQRVSEYGTCGGYTELIDESGLTDAFLWKDEDPEVKVLGTGKINIILDKKCTCHERDIAFSCNYCKETDGYWGYMEDTQTSTRWCEIFKVTILDADGWLKDNLPWSEKIHIDDFARRVSISTCKMPLDSKLEVVIKRVLY